MRKEVFKMQTKDHLALGHFLVTNTGHPGLTKHQRAFLLGCVEPDCNKITYMRGISRFKNLRGHNAQNSCMYIMKCFRQIQMNGICGASDYFVLGTVLHYVADAFTWPHNAFWVNSLREHMTYESKLHREFLRALEADRGMRGAAGALPLYSYRCLHRKYTDEFHSPKTDCRYIISACKLLLGECLQYAYSTTEERIYQGGIIYEGSYHHGLA